MGSYTDSAGHFRLDNIKPGDYDVVIRQFGFTPRVMRMKFEADETTAQQFELSPNPTVLAKVRVIAPDTARSLSVDNTPRLEEGRAQGFGGETTRGGEPPPPREGPHHPPPPHSGHSYVPGARRGPRGAPREGPGGAGGGINRREKEKNTARPPHPTPTPRAGVGG